MKYHFPWKWVILASLISTGLLLMTYNMAGSVYLSPDTIGLACGADQLATTHQFSTARTPLSAFDYVPCWTREIYPALQLVVAGIRLVTPTIDWAIGITHGLLALAFPVLTAWCVWNWKRHSGLTLWTAWLAALLPAAHSTLQLTPQGLLGTCWLLLAIGLVIRPKTSLARWGLVLPVLIGLYFSHTLSFFFAMLFLGTIWIIHKPLKHSILVFLSSAVVAILGSLFALSRTSSIFTIARGLWEQMQVIDLFQQRPIWDHASVFGFVLIPLAIFGWTSAVWTKKDKWLLVVWAAIPLVLSHLDLIGLSYLPHRMVWYMAPSVLMTAAAGMAWLIDRQRSVLFNLTAGAVLISLSIHTALLSSNNVEVYAQPLQLTPDYVAATKQLTTLPAGQLVLTELTIQDRQALHLPRLISADVISFPAHQFKNAPQFTLAQPFWAYLNEHHPTDPLITNLKNIALMLEDPTTAKEKNLYSTYRIKSMLLRKGTSEAKVLRKSNLFTVTYENETYIILQP